MATEEKVLSAAKRIAALERSLEFYKGRCDARWEKLKRLGMEWLARQIDKAGDDARLDEADAEIADLRGQVVMLRRLLADALAVLRTIEPDDTDEAKRLESLCAAVGWLVFNAEGTVKNPSCEARRAQQTGDRPRTALGQRLAAIRAAYGGKLLTPRELDKVVRERRSD